MTEAQQRIDDGGDAALGQPAYPRTLRRLVRGKNINEETLLATDYLNHFNEVIMLFELLAEMPECLDDVREWKPKSYQEHFRDSCFSDKDLAILAYENAPLRFRQPFDNTVGLMNRLVADGVRTVGQVLEAGDSGRIADSVTTVSKKLRKLIDVASAIIHGNEGVMDQAEIDAILEA